MAKIGRHIFIEGCDRVGKTTTCWLLAEALGYPVVTMPKAHEVFGDGKNTRIEDLAYVFNQTLVQLTETNFIVDRGFLTSLVYSTVFERCPNDVLYIEEVIKNLKPIVFVLVNRNLETLKQRDEQIVSDVHFEYIQSTYERIAKNRGYSVLDVTDVSPKEVVTMILNRFVYK